MQNDNFKSYIHLHFIVFIWGFTAVLGKLISLQALDLVWFRMFFAACIMAIYFLFTKETLRISPKIFVGFLLPGIIIALHWFTFYEAIKVSNVSLTLACLSTGSFFVSLLEPIIYREKIEWTNVFLGLFVIIGLYFVAFADTIQRFGFENSFSQVLTDPSVNMKGVVLSLITAFLSALFSVLNGKFAKMYNPNVISFYELSIGVFFLTIYMALTGNFKEDFFQLKLLDMFWLLLLASFCTAYAFSASIKVMKFLSPYTVMLTINLEPIYGIILALLIFETSEKMNPLFYIGAFIIILSVLVNGIIKTKKVKNNL